jgi:lysophospholipase L1-like esterase
MWLVLCLHVVASVAAAQNPQVVPTPRNSGEWRSKHDQYVAAARKGDIEILFLGDSITEYWRTAGKEVWTKSYGSLKAANFGIAGDRVENILWRMTNGELDGVKPKVVVLLAGINNSWGTKRDQQEERGRFIAAGLTEIVKTIREKLPETKILLLAIFPLGDGTAPCVRRANETIAKLDNGKTVRFLDIGPKLAGTNGNVPKEIMPDGVHPSAKGYEVWAQTIGPLLEEMLGK